MHITRTTSELLSTYGRLKATAKALDQTELDQNPAQDYVNLSTTREAGGTHQIYS